MAEKRTMKQHTAMLEDHHTILMEHADLLARLTKSISYIFDEVLTEDQRSDLMQIARQEAEDEHTPHLPPRIIVP